MLRTRDAGISYAEPSLLTKLRQSSDDEQASPPRPPAGARKPSRRPREGAKSVARNLHGGTASSAARWAGRVAVPLRPPATASASSNAGAGAAKSLGEDRSLTGLHRVCGPAKPHENPKVTLRAQKQPFNDLQVEALLAHFRNDALHKKCKGDYNKIAREVDALAGADGRRCCGRAVQQWFWSQRKKVPNPRWDDNAYVSYEEVSCVCVCIGVCARTQNAGGKPHEKEVLGKVYIYIHTYIHTYIHAYIHIYIHTYMHTYIYTYIHTYIHTYIAYMHACMHTYIHTYTYIHAGGHPHGKGVMARQEGFKGVS